MLSIIGRTLFAALVSGTAATSGPAEVGAIPENNYECTLVVNGREEPTAVFHDKKTLVIVIGAAPRGFADRSGTGILEAFSDTKVGEGGKDLTTVYPIELLDMKTRVDLQDAFVRLVSAVASAIQAKACVPVAHH